jgi:hypothetical protein
MNSSSPFTHLHLLRRAQSHRLASSVSVLAALALTLAPSGAAAATLPGESVTFKSTGSEQTFTVPAGVTSVRVQAIGAAGTHGLAEGYNADQVPGGLGAEADGQLPVTPGEVLYVEVADGSWGGGAGGSWEAGAGGGASDVRTISSSVANSEESLDSRLLVAAGGGGGGSAIEGLGGRGGNAGASGGEGVAGENDDYPYYYYDDEGGVALGVGGDPGTLTGPGESGSSCAGGQNGALGVGGGGGESYDSSTGGGGGGGGYYGGAGGSGSCGYYGYELEDIGAGGGGGGGSSYAAEDVKAPTFGLASASTEPSVTISYATPATATPSTSEVVFPGVQPQGTLSAPQTITLTNTGGTPLKLTSTAFTDSTPALETDHPEDFLVDSSDCLGEVAFEGSCQLTVRFAPQGAGASTATLRIGGNMGAGPTTIALSGTGGSLPAGEDGADGKEGTSGSRGLQGPAGPQGERGLQGYPAVYECHLRQGDGHFKTACFVRILSGSQSGSAGAQSVLRLTLRRDGVVYASGPVRGQHGQGLLMRAIRHISLGRYKLTRVSRQGSVSQFITVD